MSQHIDYKSNQHVKHELMFAKAVGLCALVAVGWFAGRGFGYLHLQHMSRQPAYEVNRTMKRQSRFHEGTVSSALTGSYVAYTPLRDQTIGKYLQLVTLVHVQSHRISQKVFVTYQRARNAQSKQRITVIKHHKVKHYMLSHLIARKMFFHSGLPYINDNFESSSRVGSVVQNASGYNIPVQTDSINGYFTPKHAQMFFGQGEPFWVRPIEKSQVDIVLAGTNRVRCNGLTYHKISERRAKQLMKRAPSTKSMMMHYRKVR